MVFFKVLGGRDVVEADIPAGGGDGDLLAVPQIDGVRDPHSEASLLVVHVISYDVMFVHGHVRVPHTNGSFLEKYIESIIVSVNS